MPKAPLFRAPRVSLTCRALWQRALHGARVLMYRLVARGITKHTAKGMLTTYMETPSKSSIACDMRAGPDMGGVNAQAGRVLADRGRPVEDPELGGERIAASGSRPWFRGATRPALQLGSTCPGRTATTMRHNSLAPSRPSRTAHGNDYTTRSAARARADVVEYVTPGGG